MNKNETYEFTEGQLKDCYHFSLPTINKFQVTYNGDKYLDQGCNKVYGCMHAKWTSGYWGGKFIEIKLDNQTTIHCNIYQKVGKDLYGNGEFQQDISGSCHTRL